MHQLEPAPHQMSKADFITAYGSIYEHSTWVAETVWAAGLGPADANPEHLAGRMAKIVDAAGQSQQMELYAHIQNWPENWRLRAASRQNQQPSKPALALTSAQPLNLMNFIS